MTETTPDPTSIICLKLCCEHGIEIVVTRKLFFQSSTVLKCLKNKPPGIRLEKFEPAWLSESCGTGFLSLPLYSVSRQSIGREPHIWVLQFRPCSHLELILGSLTLLVGGGGMGLSHSSMLPPVAGNLWSSLQSSMVKRRILDFAIEENVWMNAKWIKQSWRC